MASRYWFYFLILIKKSKNRIPIVQKSLWKLYEAALICSPSFSLRLTHSSCDHWRIQCFLDFLSSGISCRLLTAVFWGRVHCSGKGDGQWEATCCFAARPCPGPTEAWGAGWWPAHHHSRVVFYVIQSGLGGNSDPFPLCQALLGEVSRGSSHSNTRNHSVIRPSPGHRLNLLWTSEWGLTFWKLSKHPKPLFSTVFFISRYLCLKYIPFLFVSEIEMLALKMFFRSFWDSGSLTKIMGVGLCILVSWVKNEVQMNTGCSLSQSRISWFPQME